MLQSRNYSIAISAGSNAASIWLISFACSLNILQNTASFKEYNSAFSDVGMLCTWLEGNHAHLKRALKVHCFPTHTVYLFEMKSPSIKEKWPSLRCLKKIIPIKTECTSFQAMWHPMNMLGNRICVWETHAKFDIRAYYKLYFLWFCHLWMKFGNVRRYPRCPARWSAMAHLSQSQARADWERTLDPKDRFEIYRLTNVTMTSTRLWLAPPLPLQDFEQFDCAEKNRTSEGFLKHVCCFICSSSPIPTHSPLRFAEAQREWPACLRWNQNLSLPKSQDVCHLMKFLGHLHTFSAWWHSECQVFIDVIQCGPLWPIAPICPLDIDLRCVSLLTSCHTNLYLQGCPLERRQKVKVPSDNFTQVFGGREATEKWQDMTSGVQVKTSLRGKGWKGDTTADSKAE